MNLVCFLLGILIGSKIKRRRRKSAFPKQHENEKTKISSRHRVIFSVYLPVRAKESQNADLLFYLSFFMKWRLNGSSYYKHCQFSVENVVSSVIISMSFRGWFWRLVHTCDANANANANWNVSVQRKCKEREIRKRSKSIFPRWPTMIALLPIHTCGKRTQILAQEDENVFITWVDACVCVCICVGWFTRSIPCICNCVLLRSPGVLDWQREVWVLILSLS